MKARASDGSPARIFHPWTREKLTYLHKYASAFVRAMSPKKKEGRWDWLVYVDLLAGPGRGLDSDTGEEFDGSPLIALKIQPPFDRLFFGDLRKKNIEALRKRVPPKDLGRIDLRQGDCNIVVEQIVREIPPRSLGLAFVDPEGFKATFRVFRILATRPIDVLFFFPSGIGIGRNLKKFTRQQKSKMDGLWGGSEWRDHPIAKLAAGRKLAPAEERQLDQSWIGQFRTKMRAIGFKYQDEGDPSFRNEKNVPMYHLLFFSKHQAGLTLWKGVKKIEPSGQRTLPL